MSRLLLALAVLASFAPSARADDAAVFAAYDDQAGVDAAVAQQAKVSRRNQRHPTRAGVRAYIRTDKRMNRALAANAKAVAAADASSDDGRSAQVSGVREARAWRRANTIEIRANRATLAGETARADRLIRRANRIMKRGTFPAGRATVRHFKAAGFSSPRRALSATTKG